MLRYENIWEENGVYRKYYGELTWGSVIDAVEEVEGDARFDHIRYVLNDYFAVTSVNLSDYDLKKIAAIDSVASTYNKNIKIAQVTTRQDVIDVVSTYADRLKEDSYKTGIFSSLSEARKWAEE